MPLHSPWKVRIEQPEDNRIVIRLGASPVHLHDLNAAAFKAVLAALPPSQETQLDFGNVESISSVILGTLLSFRKELQSRGATLALTNVRPYIREILDVTKLTPFFLPQTQVA